MPLRIWLCLMFSAPFLALSQTAPTSTLTGTVVDATGGAVANAPLELTNTATRWTRRGATDRQGRFLFSPIPPGIYDLTVSAAGFATVKRQAIALDVDVPATVHIK